MPGELRHGIERTIKWGLVTVCSVAEISSGEALEQQSEPEGPHRPPASPMTYGSN
jgi:hypothetical protein